MVKSESWNTSLGFFLHFIAKQIISKYVRKFWCFFVNHPASLTYIINYHFKLKVACRTYRYFKAEYICTCVIQLTSPSEKPISFSPVISSAASLRVEVDGKFLLLVEEMLRVAIGWFQHALLEPPNSKNGLLRQTDPPTKSLQWRFFLKGEV